MLLNEAVINNFDHSPSKSNFSYQNNFQRDREIDNCIINFLFYLVLHLLELILNWYPLLKWCDGRNIFPNIWLELWMKVPNSDQLIKRCHHIETSQLISSANQLTGFYMMAALTLNELNTCLSKQNRIQNGLEWWVTSNLKLDSHLPQKIFIKLLQWWPFKNDEK